MKPEFIIHIANFMTLAHWGAFVWLLSSIGLCFATNFAAGEDYKINKGWYVPLGISLAFITISFLVLIFLMVEASVISNIMLGGE